MDENAPTRPPEVPDPSRPPAAPPRSGSKAERHRQKGDLARQIALGVQESAKARRRQQASAPADTAGSVVALDAGGETRDTSTTKELSEVRKGDEDQNRLAAEYDAAYQLLLDEKRAFLEKVATQYAPRFNAKLRQKWEREKPQTPEARDELIKWVEDQLESLELALLDPKTRRPAYLMATGRGEFRLVPVGGTSGTTRTDFTDLLPFQLTVAGTRKQSKTEGYATRSPSQTGVEQGL